MRSTFSAGTTGRIVSRISTNLISTSRSGRYCPRRHCSRLREIGTSPLPMALPFTSSVATMGRIESTTCGSTTPSVSAGTSWREAASRQRRGIRTPAWSTAGASISSLGTMATTGAIYTSSTSTGRSGRSCPRRATVRRRATALPRLFTKTACWYSGVTTARST
jgi:hypothetical protein